jgi:hypothetical protein
MTTYLASLAVIFGCLISASRGDVFQGPQNDATLAGNDITLTCQSTTTGLETIQFREYQTNPAGAIISSGQTLLPGHPNYFRYELTADVNGGSYSLLIRGVVLEDGGRYSCSDANALPNPSIQYADLVVLETQPNCTTTLPTNRIINVGDYYTAECIINFRTTFGIAPYMLWSGFGNFAQATVNTNTSTWAGVAFNVERVMDGRAFVCRTNFTQSGFGSTPDTATNIPTVQYTFNTGLLFVQYGPTNVTYAPIQSSYEVGQVLTCYADSVPLPSYRWTNLVTLVDYPSQSLTLTADLVGYIVLRCQVINSVSTANIFTNITVNPITTPTTPTTTTPAPTVPAIAPCDDLTGRWEVAHPDGALSVLCINVDRTQNGLVRGLWWNDTNEPYFTEIIGRTRNDEFDEIGFSTMWADRLGVTSFAGECHKCRGVENLLLNAISRSSSDQAFCAEGGTVTVSDQWNLKRVAVSFPCSSSYSTMEENMAQAKAKMPARRRRRMAFPRQH